MLAHRASPENVADALVAIWVFWNFGFFTVFLFEVFGDSDFCETYCFRCFTGRIATTSATAATVHVTV